MSQKTETRDFPRFLLRASLTFAFSVTAGIAAIAADSASSPGVNPTGANPTGAKQTTRSLQPLPGYVGWSNYTSEEYQPLTASNPQTITAFQCTGSYCDNIRLNYFYYTKPNIRYGASVWSRYFSEEGDNWLICNGTDSFMTGLSCNGSYCDNVSIQCTRVLGVAKTNCIWTGYFSEENGGYLYLPPGYFAAGLQCSGSYCDNKRVYACAHN